MTHLYNRKQAILPFAILILTLLSFSAFAQTITAVNDGTGSDVDWWGSSTTFSANWTDDINWNDPSYTGNKWYEYQLQYEAAPGDWFSVANGSGTVPDNPSSATPPRNVTITGLNLEEGRTYRITITAYHGWTGNSFSIASASSNGFQVDLTSPTFPSLTSTYNHSTNSYSLTWTEATDSQSGVANYNIQYSVDRGNTWTTWQEQVTGTTATYQATDYSTYNFRIRSRDNVGNLSDWSYSDRNAPSASITIPSVVTSNTFTIQWSGSDPETSILAYDVQYKVGNGNWQDLLLFTTSTSYQFTGNNGFTYSFRVRSYDLAGNKSDWDASGASDSVTINVLSPSISLSANPSTLSFSATENQKPVTISILATGGNVTITSIREDRNYPSWGTETGITETLSTNISGGNTYNLQRTVTLDSIARTRALGTQSEGSFTITYQISGTDTNGAPVTGSISIPVTVSGGLTSTLSINSVDIELPESPYYVGDTVENARVTINASGSGTVSGQILVDDDTSWSSNPSFSVNVDGTTSFDINGALPTDSPGDHTVKVEITDPVSITTEETYTVSSETPPFPPQTLTLVKDVAELTDLNGTANAVNGEHYVEFHFTGTAKMKVFPLKDDKGNPLVLDDVTVNELVVRYNDDNPTKAKIRGGTVEKEETDDNKSLATIGDGYIRVKKISFTGQVSPATDYLRLDTKLYIPKLKSEILDIENLTLKTEGVEAKAFSISEDKAKTFKAFGMEFRIHDVDSTQAIVIGKDKANDRYYFSLSGGVAMTQKSGTTKTKKEMTTFKGLTFYSDGDIDGIITFKKKFDIIPNKLTFNKIQIKNLGDSLVMKLAGELKNLPYPLDSLDPVSFEFKFDKDGNAEGYIVPIKELKKNQKGHGLGNNDETEWDLEIAQVDLTYLALYLQFNEGDFDKDHSEIQIGVDIYLDLKNQDGSTPTPDEKRISFGELNANEDFSGGVTISMDGDVTWHQPTNATVIHNKKLELSALTIAIDNLAVAPDPFRIIFTGGILIDLEGVSGDVEFENLAIGLDGTVSNLSDAIQGGMLDVADAVHIEVDDVDWSSQPTTLTFQADATTGEGENRAPQKAEKTVDVQSYLRFMGASISLGDSDEPAMNGGFDELTFYKLQNGSYGFVLRNAVLSTSGVDLRADIEYQNALLRVAGEVSLPNDISAIAVGKIGSQNGKPTMGIFVAASGLTVAIGPGVFLTEIGGGVFINPLQEDIELVRRIARFERPELSDEITNKRPGGAENPGAFAIMLLGGVYVSAPDFVSGRALVTITANYFNLDAEVECLEGMLDGTAYLAIGWNPAYGEGNVVVKLDYLSMIEGSGNLEFYVYSKQLWGVSGSYNISMLGSDVASGSLFVGPPGFMLEASVSYGIDLKILSGSLTYSGMFWYYKVPDPDTWGAYVQVVAEGDFLSGLFSARAGLEGALIGSPTFVIYAVGSIKVKVCYVTVFNGSLWISVGEDGFHGGKGRNSKYDGIIEEARNMADAMNQAKEELTEAMNDAKLELARLNEAQREAAGLALVERSGILGGLVQTAFINNEVRHWDPGGLPPVLQTIYNRIYGPGQQNLIEARTRLQQLMDKINRDISNLEALQQEIADRIDQYEDLLIEELPSVQQIGTLKNPFKGIKETTVNVGGTTKKVQSGFEIDENAAENQQEVLSNVREDFAKYQDAFMEEAGKIDAKLQQLDEILFQSDKSLSELARQYGSVYTEMGNYINEFVAFQGKNYQFADESLRIIRQQTSEALVRTVMQQKATAFLSMLQPSTITNWNNDRITLIQALIQAGSRDSEEQPQEYNPPEGLAPAGVFEETGVELWWNIPIAGFTRSKSLSLERRAQAIASFKESASAFRNKWAATTNLLDRIYERKSALYDILYEIYDELAEYGTGMIGVDSTGNVSNIGGLKGAGLAFRTSAVASVIASKGETLPPGTTAPDTPTIGPLRPPVPVAPKTGVPNKNIKTNTQKSFGGRVMMRPLPEKTQDSADNMHPSNREIADISIASPGIIPGALAESQRDNMIAFGGGSSGSSSSSVTPPTISGSTTFGNLNIGTIKIGPTSMGLPSTARIDRNLVKVKVKKKPLIWVPVTMYFKAKRAEIQPYLEVPSIESFTGTITSENQFTALLNASFSGDHPVGVVEYEYKVEPVFQNQGTKNTNQNTNQTNSPYGSISMQFTPLYIYIPWFTLGDLTSLTEPFFPDINKEGEYYLYIKVRGAGGKSIVRRARLSLRYFNPQGDTSPVSSNLDTSDNSPPSAPVVSLEGPYTYRRDKIYAKWNAEDLESGIQKYEYAVGTYHGESLANQIVQETTPAVQGMVESSIMGQSGTLEALSGETLEAQREVPTDVLGWHNAGGRKEINIKGLNLQHGKSYVVSVRVTNGVGLKSIGTSAPIKVDITPPEGLAITSLTQINADNHANSIKFSFTHAQDPESGITEHQFAIGTSRGSDDIIQWTKTSNNKATIVNIPLSQGEPVFVTVKATNGAGLESEASQSITLQYNDSTPPQKPIPVSLNGYFSSDTQKLGVGWASVEDPESGVVEYYYGIGTSPYSPDVYPWSMVKQKEKPYILGQKTEKYKTEEKGSQRSRREIQNSPRLGIDTTKMLDYYINMENLHLQGGHTYYLLVKAKNGSGLETIGASDPTMIDTSAPIETELIAPPYSTSREYIDVRIKAKDPESGIAAYRFAIWTVNESSYEPGNSESDIEGIAIPVAGGFTAPGTFSGTQNIQGIQVKPQTGGGGLNIQPGITTQVPPWIDDINIWGEPWFASQWQRVSSGALPQGINLNVRLSGFPTGFGANIFGGAQGLRYNNSYRIKVWVKNGAGIEKSVGVAIIRIVREIPKEKQSNENENSLPKKTNRL